MRPLSVLMVEEQGPVAEHLTQQLEALGHHVLAVVQDAHAAVESAERLQPDLILIDQHTPPHDGIEAAQAILTKRIIPLVLLIVYPTTDIVQRAQEAGILSHLYLSWSADTQALETAIGVALTQYRELQALYAKTGDFRQALRIRSGVNPGTNAADGGSGALESRRLKHLREQR